jgi:drug/metabolite transporter (DMT)-like permease
VIPFYLLLAAAGLALMTRWDGTTLTGAGGTVPLVAAGLGFGLFYVLMDRVAAGLVFGPLVASRTASLAAVGAIALAGRPSPRGLRAVGPLVVIAGLLDVGGNAGFLLAAQAGRLDVASVLASLYPAVTVLLAVVVLREHVGPRHAIGITAALVAIALIGGR